MSEQPRHHAFLRACNLIVAVGLLNFVAFAAGAFYLGGDAVSGKIEEGRYYVFGVGSESGRKVYTEVSKSAFTYSKWHVYSLWTSWPLVMLAGFARDRYKKRQPSTGHPGANT